ncbi:MAG: aminotransferase, partial [Candidatus Marinimicrobia bacterium]|nr:aminotransferase [Candidatus Neomarinimicrobiota bacterium]
ALEAREQLQALIGEPPLCAQSEEWIAQMFAVLLPAQVDPERLEAELFTSYRIEVAVKRWQGFNLLRVSVAAYTTAEDLERLTEALRELL